MRQRETSKLAGAAGRKTIPVVLTIAGSDCSGGAGIQADLKTFTTLGVYGTTAVTCVVAEHPDRVFNITPIPPQRVADQIGAVLEAFPVAAIKTGMLFSSEIIEAVHAALQPALAAGIPLVIDPVMVASSGRPLLKKNGVKALCALMAQATLVIPNRHEAEALWKNPLSSIEEMEKFAVAWAAQLDRPFILAKGGHFSDVRAVDVLASPTGKVRRFSSKRIPNLDPHGTGCTYSAAITVGLAQGLPLEDAVALGKRFINRALRDRFALGGYQLLNQLPSNRAASSRTTAQP